MSVEHEILCRIEKRLAQLECSFNNSRYKTPLSGTSFNIPAFKHKLKFVTGYFVYDAAGEGVELNVIINTDMSVIVNSNIDMTGLTIIIFQ